MRAAMIHEHGDASVLRIDELADPQAGPGEVVLKVLCAGLNHLDIWVRKGRPGLELRMPHVLGSDAVGVVQAVGANVQSPQVGDEVIVNGALSCGRCEFCLRGEHSMCASFGIVGLSRPGTFAEQVAVPACNVYPKPAHMSAEEAGGFALSCVTAWRMLMGRAQVKPGDCILIHGIGGGVALCALQLAKLMAVEVVVTSSSDDKLTRAAELGADHGINYRREDVIARVREITGGRGVDVAVDSVGAATWPLDFAAVRKGGKIVLCGVTTGAEAPTDLRALYWNQLTAMGSTMGSAEDFRQMIRAVDVGMLKPVVDEVFPLEEVHAATEKMEAGRQFGKIVLKVAP